MRRPEVGESPARDFGRAFDFIKGSALADEFVPIL
jgi:hypothetical protein